MREYMVNVEYSNGYKTICKDTIAAKYEKQGKLKILKSVKEVPQMDLSDDIKALIKEAKGLGIKSAIKMFLEAGADTDEKQLEIIGQFAIEG